MPLFQWNERLILMSAVGDRDECERHEYSNRPSSIRCAVPVELARHGSTQETRKRGVLEVLRSLEEAIRLTSAKLCRDRIERKNYEYCGSINPHLAYRFVIICHKKSDGQA